MNRVLLARAFPDGYLAMRGASTVGGWTCCEADTTGRATSWRHSGGATAYLFRFPDRVEVRLVADPTKPDPMRAVRNVNSDLWFSAGDWLPDYNDPLTRFAIWRALGRVLKINDADNGVLLQVVGGGRIVSLTTLHASESFDVEYPDDGDRDEEDAVLTLLVSRQS